MGKNILAGTVGVVLAGSIVMIVEMIGHTIFPPPPDLDFSDSEALRAYIGTLPAIAMLFPVLGWTIGTLGGTVIACRIGTAKPLTFASIVGGLILAGTAFNLATIPHPLWVAILGVVGIVAGAWFGMKLGTRSSEAAE